MYEKTKVPGRSQSVTAGGVGPIGDLDHTKNCDAGPASMFQDCAVR